MASQTDLTLAYLVSSAIPASMVSHPEATFDFLFFACWYNLPKSVGQPFFRVGVRELPTTGRHIILVFSF